jgi:hypothetical protein
MSKKSAFGYEKEFRGLLKFKKCLFSFLLIYTGRCQKGCGSEEIIADNLIPMHMYVIELLFFTKDYNILINPH